MIDLVLVKEEMHNSMMYVKSVMAMDISDYYV